MDVPDGSISSCFHGVRFVLCFDGSRRVLGRSISLPFFCFGALVKTAQLMQLLVYNASSG
jgi:hypothetical protein